MHKKKLKPSIENIKNCRSGIKKKNSLKNKENRNLLHIIQEPQERLHQSISMGLGIELKVENSW